MDTLKLILSYLTNRYHKVKVGSRYSEMLKMTTGIPQGPILGPLFFNIFTNDLFYFLDKAEICNFADDNTLYASGYSIAEVINKLQNEIKKALQWLRNNTMAANPEKFQIMFLGTNKTNIDFDIGNIKLKSSSHVKLLGIKIDNKLKFNDHIEEICKSASGKIKALNRIRPYLDIETARKLVSAHVLSNFNYCPLIWMNANKTCYDLINKTHKRALRAVYQDFNSSLDVLLLKDNSEHVHIRNIKNLMIEVFS